MEPEDTYAIAVLRALDEQPRTPSRVDLFQAISIGRRRRRVRRLLQAGTAAVVTAVAVASVPLVVSAVAKPDRQIDPVTSKSATPTPSPRPDHVVPQPIPPKTCYVQRLPVPGGHPMSLVTGGDPTGRFIVGRAYPEAQLGDYPLIIWDNGKGRTVKMPGMDQAFRDITSTGVAVGTTYGTTSEGGRAPYVFRNGVLSKLAGVASGGADAINEAGVIAGSRDLPDRSIPVRWRSATEPAEDLPLPGKTWSGEAIAIGEDGTILGKVGQTRDAEQGYVWRPDGTTQLLPKPSGTSTFRPFDMNGDWVTGLGESGNGQLTPVLYNLRTGRFTRWSATGAIPSAVNAVGWVVGSTNDGRAFLSSSGGMRMLPDLNNHKSPTANHAKTISDDGRTIAGQGDDAKGVIQAVVWRCR
ncbi:MAG TPA: hypothetical protein VFR67_30175 [Pilimelia sp.]|nr:hypothetical protein [Pilimelia sp.]